MLNGYFNVAKILIQHGAEINTSNKRGKTLLAYAAYNGDINFAILLIQNGAEINICDFHQSINPLIDAASNGHLNLAHLLIHHGADPTDYIMKNATNGNCTLLKFLIDHDSGLHKWSKLILNLVSKAAMDGNYESVMSIRLYQFCSVDPGRVVDCSLDCIGLNYASILSLIDNTLHQKMHFTHCYVKSRNSRIVEDDITQIVCI